MPAKPEAVEVAPAPPPNKKKTLLIIVAAVVLLGLAGGAGWFFLSKKNAAHDGEEAEAASEPAREAPRGPPVYLPLDNMVVNLADPGGEKVAQVGVTLELSDSKAPEKVKAYLPAIRNGILLLVSQRTAEELLRREGKEKLADDILADALHHVANEASHGKAADASAGENLIRGVLFSGFIVQ